LRHLLLVLAFSIAAQINVSGGRILLAFLAFRPTLLNKPDPKSAAFPSCRS
jgi:hypothetical protein